MPKPICAVEVQLLPDGNVHIEIADCDASVACHLLSRAQLFMAQQPLRPTPGIVEAPAGLLPAIQRRLNGQG